MKGGPVGHYLQLQVAVGKDGFDRVYFPLAHEDETVAEATERWLDTKVKGRQRNVAKTRAAWRARIEMARVSHPTSWHEANATGFFAPKSATPRRRGRRR